MPQTLSKCGHPLNGLVTIPKTFSNDQQKTRIPQKKRKCRWRGKKDYNNSVPQACTVPAQASQHEDWESEIDEFLHRMREEKEKEIKNQNPYDAEDALNTAACDMNLHNVSRAQSPKQLHYFPSAHHKPPVEWTHHIYTVVQDQFADAEEQNNAFS